TTRGAGAPAGRRAPSGPPPPSRTLRWARRRTRGLAARGATLARPEHRPRGPCLRCSSVEDARSTPSSRLGLGRADGVPTTRELHHGLLAAPFIPGRTVRLEPTRHAQPHLLPRHGGRDLERHSAELASPAAVPHAIAGQARAREHPGRGRPPAQLPYGHLAPLRVGRSHREARGDERGEASTDEAEAHADHDALAPGLEQGSVPRITGCGPAP